MVKGALAALVVAWLSVRPEARRRALSDCAAESSRRLATEADYYVDDEAELGSALDEAIDYVGCGHISLSSDIPLTKTIEIYDGASIEIGGT